jgi:hypothetical protein
MGSPTSECELCAGHGDTAGELLAAHLTNATAIARAAAGAGPGLWIWDDMFNPHHNAHDGYFLINGTVAGSWEGIPPEVNVMNWGPPVGCACGGWGSPTCQKKGPPGSCLCRTGRNIYGVQGVHLNPWACSYAPPYRV